MFSCDSGGGNGFEFDPNLNIGVGGWLAKTVTISYDEECDTENLLPDFFDYSTLPHGSQRGMELNTNGTYWFNFIPYDYELEENQIIAACPYGYLCEQEGSYVYEDGILTTCDENFPDICIERTVEAIGVNLINLNWTLYPIGPNPRFTSNDEIIEDVVVPYCEIEIDLTMEHHSMQTSN